MAELVLKQHLEADVGYHAFGLQECDDAALPVPFPDGFTRGVFLNVFPGRLDIFSAGHTHTASVDVEVWDAQPHVREPGAWDEQAEADFESTSGEVALWSMSLGRTEAAALSEDEGTGQGVERYLMQFWPAKS